MPPISVNAVTDDPQVRQNISERGMSVAGACGFLGIPPKLVDKWLDEGEDQYDQGKQGAQRRFWEMAYMAEAAFEDQQLRTYHEKIAENKAPVAAQAIDILQLRIPTRWRRKQLAAEVEVGLSYEQTMEQIRRERTLAGGS